MRKHLFTIYLILLYIASGVIMLDESLSIAHNSPIIIFIYILTMIGLTIMLGTYAIINEAYKRCKVLKDRIERHDSRINISKRKARFKKDKRSND